MTSLDYRMSLSLLSPCYLPSISCLFISFVIQERTVLRAFRSLLLFGHLLQLKLKYREVHGVYLQDHSLVPLQRTSSLQSLPALDFRTSQLLQKLKNIFRTKPNQSVDNRSAFCKLPEPTGRLFDVVRRKSGSA